MLCGRLCRVWILILVVAATAGCSGSAAGPATVRATGTVTYLGKPVAGANVIFYPGGNDEGLASQSVTDPEGRFELSTHVGGGKFKPGIAPGQYMVAITKLDTAGITSTLAPPKSLLPRKYSSPQTSKLNANAATGQENDFSFSLTAD